jgi:FkbM family methyltransferase
MFLVLILIFNYIICGEDISFARKLIYKYTNNLNLNLLEENKNSKNLGYGDGRFESNGELFVLKNFIKKDYNVFDVGANVGEWSKEIFNLNLNCLVYAFEPVPEVFKKLIQCKFDSNLFYSFNFGFGIQDDILRFFYLPNLNGMSSIYYRPVFDDLAQKIDQIEVSIKTVDNFVKNNNINKINFLKIDTEGSEFNVLMGARESIKNGIINIVQFEYGGCYLDGQKKLSDIYHLFKSNNYLIFRIIPDGLIYIKTWDESLENYTYSNYLALRIQ